MTSSSSAPKHNHCFSFLSLVDDYCHGNPCKNGGSCLNLDDRFECVCTENAKGHQCEGRKFPLVLCALLRGPGSSVVRASAVYVVPFVRHVLYIRTTKSLRVEIRQLIKSW